MTGLEMMKWIILESGVFCVFGAVFLFVLWSPRGYFGGMSEKQLLLDGAGRVPNVLYSGDF